ncbi:MAG: phosphotransferase, partial [Thermomicrobiales bacterium]
MPTEVAVDEILLAIGFDRESAWYPVTGGADALLWKIEAGTDTFALRLLSEHQHAQSATEIEISDWITRRSSSVVVPRIVHSGSWNGRPAYLMSWIDGQALGNALLDPSTSSETRASLAESFGETQAHIHSMTPPPGLQRFSDSWRSRIGDPALQNALNLHATGRDAFLHLDFHPLNILVEGDRLVAVLDWANAEIGDPIIDLARTEAILQLAPTPPGTDPALIDNLIAGWKHGYERVAGPADIPDVARWWA